MKKSIDTDEQGGLEALLGERVTLFCLNYFYTGDLVEVNNDFVSLKNGGIVFDTGSYADKDWLDYQPLPNQFYVRIPMIEAYGVVK